MKKILTIIAQSLSFSVFSFSLGFASPDLRDSVIIESKAVYSGVGSPAAFVRVYITNKDTLAAFTLPLVERSVTGSAYMALGWPRTYLGENGAVRWLTTYLQGFRVLATKWYDGFSPDSFTIVGLFDPLDISGTAEPPNLTRKAFLEIKFDTVQSDLGTVELDSAIILDNYQHFTSLLGEAILTNFVKGFITTSEPLLGDINRDGILTIYDVVMLCNRVYCGIGNSSRADVNCDGILNSSDVVALLNRVALNQPLPCQP